MVNLEITGRMGVTTKMVTCEQSRLIVTHLGGQYIHLRHDNDERGVLAYIDELREIVARWNAGV